MKKSNQMHSSLPCLMLILIALFWTAFTDKTTGRNVDSVISAVEKEVGSINYPFDTEGEKGDEVMGVDTSTLDSYFADIKIEEDSKEEYILFVGKANSDKDAENAAQNLDRYLKVEEQSMDDYLSETGKAMLMNGQVGSSGKWCWAVVMETDSLNKKVVGEIRNAE